MKNIIAINTSPRTGWNTSMMVREAARGAQESGARVDAIDLYRMEKFMGCTSCFGCKREPNMGICVNNDGLAPVLQKIREADGLILGTANYLGSATAGFHALYERLIFQSLTYNREKMNCNERPIPVLFIMTGNAPDSAYAPDTPYGNLLAQYHGALSTYVGPTKTLVVGSTLQVNDYSKYNWTIFDPEERKTRRENVFPGELKNAFEMGAKMAAGNWS